MALIDPSELDDLSSDGLKRFLFNQQIDFDCMKGNDEELRDLCLFYLLSNSHERDNNFK